MSTAGPENIRNVSISEERMTEAQFDLTDLEGTAWVQFAAATYEMG